MVRKRKKKEEEVIWCYYCDRTFQDEPTLIVHQKNKHWKCEECNRKLNSAKALGIHCIQVHKVPLISVPAAKEGRDSPQMEIYGMAGIPYDMQPGMDAPGAADPPTAAAAAAASGRLRHAAAHPGARGATAGAVRLAARPPRGAAAAAAVCVHGAPWPACRHGHASPLTRVRCAGSPLALAQGEWTPALRATQSPRPPRSGGCVADQG